MQELGSQPLPTISNDEIDNHDQPRQRSGTWGSKSDGKHHKESKEASKQKAKEKAKQDVKVKDSKEKKKKKDDKNANRSGSASRSSSAERKRSDEEILSPKKAGMLDAFRNRSHSDASKKKGMAFMATMKSMALVSIQHR